MTTILLVAKDGTISQSPIVPKVALKSNTVRPEHQQMVFAMMADGEGISGLYCGASDAVSGLHSMLHWEAVAGWWPIDDFILPHGIG